MRRVHWAVTRPAGRLVSRFGFGTRIHPADWDPVPRSPVESVPLIAPTPLLIVHGDQDAYFPLDHPLRWPPPRARTAPSCGSSTVSATPRTRRTPRCWAGSAAG